MMDRKQELLKLFKDVDENQKKLVDRLLDEVVHIKKRTGYVKRTAADPGTPERPV